MKNRWMKAARVASAVVFWTCLAPCVASFFVTVDHIHTNGPNEIIRERFLHGGYFRERYPAPPEPPLSLWEVHPHWAPHYSYALHPPQLGWNAPFFWLPFWIPLGIFGVLPAAGVVGRWRERRRASRAGRCARCGYDLRATPERCPECGTACGAGGEVKRV